MRRTGTTKPRSGKADGKSAGPRKTTGPTARREPEFETGGFLTAVAGRAVATYQPAKFIFRQGAKCDALYYVQQGRVALNVVSKAGKERIVALLGAGSFIGEASLSALPVYAASARTLTEATVLRIEAQTMMQVLHDRPEVAGMFMSFLLRRNSEIESDLVDQLFNSSEKRLARLLIALLTPGSDGQMREVVAPLSQEVMAARVGTTRSRINYFMNKFRKLGLIEYNGHLKVHAGRLAAIIAD